jgi:hypothetical protein
MNEAGPWSKPDLSMRPLVRHILKNTPKPVKTLLKEIDNVLVSSLRQRKHILYSGICPMNYAIFEPVYDRLKEDERLTIYFTNPVQDWNFCERFNVPREKFIASSEVRYRKWDLSICTDLLEQPTRRKTKRIFIPHGLGNKKAVNGPYMLSEGVLAFDRICFCTRPGYFEFKNHFSTKADQVASLTGFPHMDYLVKNSFNSAERRKRTARTFPGSVTQTFSSHGVDDLHATRSNVQPRSFRLCGEVRCLPFRETAL